MTMEWLSQIINQIPDASLPALATIAVVLEFAFRLLKTKKPLSIAWLVVDGLVLVASGLTKVAALLDKVLPQRVKE
jgi:hypothetical protein